MKKWQRKSRAMTVTLLVLLASIGPAGAVGPQQMIHGAGISATPMAMPALPERTVSRRPAPAAEKQPSLLPNRAPHAGVATDLFAGHSWYTPPPAAAVPVRERRTPVNRKPTAPPLPFSYIGSLEQDGTETFYYLVKGDRVYDVKVGDVIDDTYKIDGITNGQLMFTYLPLDTSQGLRLGD